MKQFSECKQFDQGCGESYSEVVTCQFPKVIAKSRISDGNVRYDVTGVPAEHLILTKLFLFTPSPQACLC